jgi:hypothetical protein
VKKNISKLVSVTISSLFILSSTVAVGMIGADSRNIVQAPLNSLEEPLEKQEDLSSDNSLFAAKSSNEALANSTVTDALGQENLKTFAAADKDEAPEERPTTFSRGGINPNTYKENSSSTEKAEKPVSDDNIKASSKKEVELLDWWKSGRTAFPKGATATVKDLYTGKTFKVKRTMGDNHADTEALTLEDTKIIKSIWGGFSWERRPIHIYINGRILAASMSAMPHAGIDSAAAYAYVKNRSENYGAGSNLDVVKNNGMDGHFDIHFLNSTRHKDGKTDPQHQAAVKIAKERR